MKRQAAIIGSAVLGILVVATVFWAKGSSNVVRKARANEVLNSPISSQMETALESPFGGNGLTNWTVI